MELAPLAFLAGILSISSPSCLPLIAGYFYIWAKWPLAMAPIAAGSWVQPCSF
jgi:cytochrome c biogenesis protein CcdA